MKNSKKTMLISWFIGLGCGLFLSGIILSVLVYTSKGAEPIPQEPPTDQVEAEDDQLLDSDDPGSEEAVDIEEDMTPEEETDAEIIELEISSTATASEITNMLVEHNIIPDYDEFMAYIVSQDAERKLIHGIKKFPLDSDEEKVLEILTKYQ